MSGDGVPMAWALPRAASEPCKAATLYQELRNPLLRYLVCLGLSADEAQDVVQDAFLSLQRHLPASGSEENVRSWLFRVAHNAARNRQMSYERRFRAPLDSRVEALSDGSSPEGAVLEREKLRRLEWAIETLSVTERECLLLRAEGLRYREIGEVLGISTSSVGDTVLRAVRKLAEQCHV